MPITVTLLYFGRARDASGRSEELFSLPDGSTAGTLLDVAVTAHSRLKILRGSVKLALNEELAEGDEVLSDGDIVALLPPVAGG